MRYTIKLPKLGDTAEDALVGDWAAEVGDVLSAGDPLFSAETDKVEIDVPTPVAGTLVEKLVEREDEVFPGTPVAVIET